MKTESVVLNVIIGVPQGSTLGPLLFIIYINDIVGCSELFTVLFADDAAFVASGKKLKKVNKIVNEEMKKVSSWLIANRLTLNLKKTKFMIYYNKRDDKKEKLLKKFKININNYCIEQVSNFKYLGVIFNNKLNWNDHIEVLCSKLSRAAGVIFRLKKNLPHSVLKMIYHSLVSSHLRYGILNWGSANCTALKRLNTLHDRIIRYLNPRISDIDHVYKDLGFLKIEGLYHLELSKFIYRIKMKSNPKAFDNYILPVSHSHQTRSNQNGHYQAFKPKTEKGKTLICYRGVTIFQSNPQ